MNKQNSDIGFLIEVLKVPETTERDVEIRDVLGRFEEMQLFFMDIKY